MFKAYNIERVNFLIIEDNKHMSVMVKTLLVAFGASWAHRRREWWRLAAVAAFVAGVILPWRFWYADRGISGDAPSSIDQAGGDTIRGGGRIAGRVIEQGPALTTEQIAVRLVDATAFAMLHPFC